MKTYSREPDGTIVERTVLKLDLEQILNARDMAKYITSTKFPSENSIQCIDKKRYEKNKKIFYDNVYQNELQRIIKENVKKDKINKLKNLLKTNQ